MENRNEFVDYYDLLQVDPRCDARILTIAYHHFAKKYHPDHSESADVDKFNKVVTAYNVLRDSDKRAEYDRDYIRVKGDSKFQSPLNNDPIVDNETALSDAEIHKKILLSLYKRRRERANDAGVAGWLLQELLECSEEHFEFHVWYLKSKGFIQPTEQGTLAITIQGVDHVFSISKADLSEKLAIAERDNSEAQD